MMMWWLQVWGVGGDAVIHRAFEAQGRARELTAENIAKARKVRGGHSHSHLHLHLHSRLHLHLRFHLHLHLHLHTHVSVAGASG
jgi:hypothetical protein